MDASSGSLASWLRDSRPTPLGILPESADVAGPPDADMGTLGVQDDAPEAILQASKQEPVIMEEGDEIPDSSSLKPSAALGIEPSRKRGGGGPFLIQCSACTHSFSRQRIGVGKTGYAHPISCPSCKHHFRPSRATCSCCAMPALRCSCRAIDEPLDSVLVGIGPSSSSSLLPPSSPPSPPLSSGLRL